MKTEFTPIGDAERNTLRETLKTKPSYQQVLGNAILLDTPDRLCLGESVSCASTLFNTASGWIYIGDWSFFGQDCAVLTGEHPSWERMDARQQSIVSEGNDIVIGKGVWIASRAIIIGPCRIGDHAVIAAGSVVLPGDYEGGCMYAGNPAVFKKRIEFDPEKPPKPARRFA
jgi:acetyltransferase-like isoleucine patch superfamily enzyme